MSAYGNVAEGQNVLNEAKADMGTPFLRSVMRHYPPATP
ncbi:hypothetical protein B932_3342 [Gluconobacter oxydans H24]|nr:hypothetical protein B932_3342 [Gluconobacter oxydans H24]